LRRALIAGAPVIASRDGLNKIDAFPAADGDTGNNLASTLGSVLNGALSRRSRHAGELLRGSAMPSMAHVAIVAQFLHRTAERVKPLPSLDAQSLAAVARDLDGRDYLDKLGLSTHEFYRHMLSSALFARKRAPEAFARRLPASVRWRAMVSHCTRALRSMNPWWWKPARRSAHMRGRTH
jgi:hypothetical protein